MYAYQREQATQSSREAKFASPSDELRIAVTFKRSGKSDGPTKFSAPLSLSSAMEFRPDPMTVDRAVHQLSQWVSGRLGGENSASPCAAPARCSSARSERHCPKSGSTRSIIMPSARSITRRRARHGRCHQNSSRCSTTPIFSGRTSTWAARQFPSNA